jgi:6-phosphogluconolactonase
MLLPRGGETSLGVLVPVTVLADRNALMRAAADRVVDRAVSAIATRGRFDWALAGGSTPEALYRLLASPDYVGRVDWSRVHFFWGDERCVPPEHPDSNYRMARLALLDALAPSPENVHRMAGELPPRLAAERYEAELERCFGLRVGDGFPELDLILLGMGGDGHTASLFPGTPGLAESRRWVIDNPIESLGVTRLTLTFPVLDAAAHVLFLVAGADKAERLAQVLSGASVTEPLPAQRVHPRVEDPEWLVDAAAAACLGPMP